MTPNSVRIKNVLTVSNGAAIFGNVVISNGQLVVGGTAINSTSVSEATNNAYSNAVSYTDTKIGTANTAITGNAATAYTNAVSYTDTKIGTANTAMAANAGAAYTNATIFAANASNANNGTLAEARLPHRMNQDVRTSDSPTFANMTLSGNLTVSGTRTYVNTTTLDVGDNIITLNADLGANPPTESAGIEIMRGTSANVQFLWDETNDRWTTNNQELAVSSFIANGAASGITTLAAGNTTITGFANVSTTLQIGTNTATFGTASFIVANGNFGIANSTPGQKLTVAGTIESTTGGIKFPDSTTQTSAGINTGKSIAMAMIFGG